MARTGTWLGELDVRRGPAGSAVFSACGRYRYELTRDLEAPARLFGEAEATRGTVCWVLANPSVADEAVLDTTLTRCAGYSRAWGFSAMVVRNVLA